MKKEIGNSGKVYITSGFNNTLITMTDPSGQVLLWESSGTVGFKGARKATPFAASTAALEVARKALEMGVSQVSAFVKGPGSGRDAAVKSLKAGGLEVMTIADITPIPHNGCRPKKRRRV